MRLPLIGKNPLTMVGTLDRCWLFTFCTPVEAARRHLPAPLEPVTHGDCAFWNVVVSRIERMRPKPSPPFAGVSYWHIGYRLYARFQPPGDEPSIEGLFFARSDCDSRLMSVAGNLLTDFRFHTARVIVANGAGGARLRIDSPDAPATALLCPDEPPRLPDGSPFATLDEAARLLKYQPFGVSVDEGRDEVNVVRIVRDEAAWRSRLLHVAEQDWRFFAGENVQPEICYEVAPIFYQWNRARVYRLG